MSRYVKYAILAIGVFTFGAFYTPELIGETGSATVAKDNTKNLSAVVLSADPSITIEENQEVDLAKGLNLAITGSGLDDTGALLSKVEVLTDLDVSVPGTYDVTFSLVDESLKIDSAVSSTVVVNPVNPVISLATTDVSVPAGSDVDYLSAFGVSATEFTSGDLADSITVSTDANLDVPGTYPVSFTATDSDGQVATVSATVRAKPQVKELTLTVPKEINILEETGYSDSLITGSGLTVKYGNSVVTGDATYTITPPAGFSTNIPTTSPFEFSVVAHYDGKSTGSKVIKVNIKAVPPVISTVREHYTIGVGSPQPTQQQLIDWFGITATETGSGDVTLSHVYENNGGFEVGKARTYPIRFTATDDDGQKVTRIVNLHVKKGEEVNKAPVITSVAEGRQIWNEETAMSAAQAIELFAVSAVDYQGNPISSDQIIVDLTQVDFAVPNEDTGYPVTFSVTADEESDSITRTLYIKDLLPAVTANGSVFELVLGETLPDDASLKSFFGVVGTEVTTGDSTSSVMVERPNMTEAMVGDEFEVEFHLIDEESNHATPVMGMVKIVAPETEVNQPPVIKAKVLNKKVFEQASTVPLTTEDMLKLFKISITDAENGDLTIEIIPRPGTSTTVVPTNYDHPGNYKLQLVVTETKLVGEEEVVVNTVTQDLNLKIKEVYPWIEVIEYEAFLPLGSDPIDPMKYFRPVASEFVEGDLTAGLMYETYTWDAYGEEIIATEIDYENGGEYVIRFFVSDEEGNLAETYVYLYIGDEYEEGINISSSKYQIVPEEIALKVQDFIDLYGINAVTTWFENVNQYVDIVGNYDIGHPDVYPLTISVDYYGLHKDFDIVLEVEDTLPEIEARTNKISIDTDDNLGDLVTTFGVTATEITPSDLTAEIKVDDSAIETENGDYVAGTYPVTFTATDEEGNETATTTEVEVTSDDTEETIVDDNKETIVSEVDDSDDDVEETTTTTATTTTMTLANTGSSAVAIGLVLLFSLVGIFLVRLGLTSQKNHDQK